MKAFGAEASAVWPLVVCTHSRTSDAERSLHARQRAKRKAQAIQPASATGSEQNPLLVNFRGSLSQHALQSAFAALSQCPAGRSEAGEGESGAGAVQDLQDDGRRMSVCMVLLQLAPERTLQHPVNALHETWFSDIEGPFWQRYNWTVRAVSPLTDVVCAPDTVASRHHAPVMFALGRGSIQAMQSSISRILDEWCNAGIYRPVNDRLPAVLFAVGLPKVLCHLILHRVVNFLGISMRRDLPRTLPQVLAKELKNLKYHAKMQAETKQTRALTSQPAEPSAGLTTGSFQHLVETLDGWSDLLSAATAANPDRRQDVEQEFHSLRAWASRLAFELHPVQVAASKVEGSRLQRGLLGKAVRKRMARWFPGRPNSMHAADDTARDAGQRGRYTAWFAIHAVMFASHLKNSDTVDSALRAALHMAFQKDVAADLLHMLEQSATPSAATMSRWRLIFEAATCLRLRELFEGYFQISPCPQPEPQQEELEQCNITFHALLDSSPQGGRDWLLSELQVLGHRTSLEQMLQHCWKLCAVSEQAQGFSDLADCPDLLQEIRKLSEALNLSLEVVVLPPAGLGHQRSNLQHKLHAFLHSIWLGSGTSMRKVVSSISSFTTDFGTESGISGMSAPSEVVCPQLCDASDQTAFQSFDDLGSAVDPWPELSFQQSLQVPGVLHIMHNICADMCEQLPSFASFKVHLQALAVFLCDPHVRRGMQERCFGQGLGRSYKDRFDSFSDRLIDWRWQSLSDFLAAMEPLEAPLREFWNLQAFLGKSGASRATAGAGMPVDAAAEDAIEDPNGPDAEGGAALVQVSPAELAEHAHASARAKRFDLAVRDANVWDYMSMLRALMKIPDELLQWFQTCPCHVSGVHPEHPLSGHSCVLKGRRGPEMACGFLQQFAGSKLDCADRLFAPQSTLFNEYVAGLQHLSFMLQLKFAHWTCLPYSLLGLAHPNESQARAAARRILAEWENMPDDAKQGAHVLCKSFLSESGRIRSSILCFVQGASINDVRCLPWCSQIARLAFLPLLERSIEGRHAVVKRATDRAAHHSGAYVSSALRLPALLKQVQKQPEILLQLANSFSKVRLPFFVLTHLGLQKSPAVLKLQDLPDDQRKNAMRSFGFADRVMFRLDAASQYTDWEDVFLVPGRKKRNPNRLPLHDAASNELQRHLALEHFRAVCSDKSFSASYYAAVLPLAADAVGAESEFPFREMCTALSAAPGVDAVMDGSGEIACFEPDTSAETPAGSFLQQRVSQDLTSEEAERDHHCVLFKVQHWRPSLLKQVKGACMTSLQAADLAVTLYPLSDVVATESEKVLVTTGVPRGSGESLTRATALVNEALFRYKVFRFQDASDVQVEGMKPRVALAKPVSVLQLRMLDSRAEWTRFECMQFLLDQGWVALLFPAKAKRGRPLTLQLAMPEEDVDLAPEDGSRLGCTWYFKASAPMVSRDYLQAMVAVQEHRQDLLALGLEHVRHDAPVKYFQCLIRLSLGLDTLENLKALEPTAKRKRVTAFDSQFEALEPVPDQPCVALQDSAAAAAVEHEASSPDGVASQHEVGGPSGGGALDDDDMDELMGFFDDDVFEEPEPAAVSSAADILSPAYNEDAPRHAEEVGGPDALVPPPPPPSAAAKAAPARGKERSRHEKTHSWGAFLITYKVQSAGTAKESHAWQATCPKPEHNPNKRTKCTKTMSFKAGDRAAELSTLWRVRHWCSSCHLFDDKIEHQAYHPQLQELPEESAIEACRVDDFLPAAAVPAAAPAAAAPGAAESSHAPDVSDSESASSSDSSSSSSSSSS